MGDEERREQGETAAQAKAHQEEEVAAAGGEQAQDGVFLSAMASRIGATMSGTNGSGGEANAAAASDGGEALKRDGDGDGDGDPGEEGGFLIAMASRIGAAMSGANGGSESDGGGTAAVASDEYDEGKEKDEGNGGGGIFHKLLSSSPAASSPASGMDSLFSPISASNYTGQICIFCSESFRLIDWFMQEHWKQRKQKGKGRIRACQTSKPGF